VGRYHLAPKGEGNESSEPEIEDVHCFGVSFDAESPFQGDKITLGQSDPQTIRSMTTLNST
jgi:hypothetical protein